MKKVHSKQARKGGGRNLHAIAPIMRKGGAHEKSESAKRSAARRELRDVTRLTAKTLGRGHSAEADQCAA